MRHQERSGPPGSSLALSASSMRRAASCSAARRDLPSPDLAQAERRHRALDLEGLGMRLAAGGDDAVGRHRQAARLQPFLQLGLGVLGPAADVGGLDDLAEQAAAPAPRAASKPPSRKVAPISASSASARIEARMRAAAARLAFAEAQQLGQAELQRRAVQAVLAHEVGAHPGQVAFVGAAEAVEQQARDGQAQDGVAEELEALVVVGAEAAVGQRPLQQRRVGEAVADALLQGDEAGIHA